MAWHRPVSSWTLASSGCAFPNPTPALNCASQQFCPPPPPKKKKKRGGKKGKKKGGKKGKKSAKVQRSGERTVGGSKAKKVLSKKYGGAGAAKANKGNAKGPPGLPLRGHAWEHSRNGGSVGFGVCVPGEGERRGTGGADGGHRDPALTRGRAAPAAPATSRPRRAPRPTAAPKHGGEIKTRT